MPMPFLALSLVDVGVVVDALVLTSPSLLGRRSRKALLQRWPQPDPERVFFVGELVDKIACVAEEGEVGIDGT